MPAFKEGETRQEWMSRCVPIRHKEHPDEKNEQSVAVCFSMWREHEKKKAKAELTEKEKEGNNA
jgi:hypothetical protein